MGIEIGKTATVNVSAERLWSILGDDFDKVSEWASSVDASAVNPDAAVPEGAVIGGRVCQAPGFGAINETLTHYDPVERSYSFEATASKIPSFVRNITNHTTVTPLGPDRAKLEVRITADTDGIRGALVKPVMTRKFSSTIDQLIEDLTIFAQSGKPSAQKSKALAKAGR